MKRMGAATWLDRITDESNVWLSAVKAEERNDLETAAVLFLNDASTCLEENSPAKSALSCSSGADCLMRAGVVVDGKRLYFEAGVMYTELADSKLSTSIRESLWALQRAYECFAASQEWKQMEAAREAFILLAKRTNPFAFRAEGLRLPDLAPKETPTPRSWMSTRATGPARAAIAHFLEVRRGAKGPRPDSSEARGREGEIIGQESIARQLG